MQHWSFCRIIFSALYEETHSSACVIVSYSSGQQVDVMCQQLQRCIPKDWEKEFSGLVHRGENCLTDKS